MGQALDARSLEAEAPGRTVGRVWSSWTLGDTPAVTATLGGLLAVESGRVHAQAASGPGTPWALLGMDTALGHRAAYLTPGAILGAPGPILQVG